MLFGNKWKRWLLRNCLPNEAAEWKPKERLQILRYVHKRDKRVCGLCGNHLKLAGRAINVNIEHIVPKAMFNFDIVDGYATVGNTFTSKLHHVDNLQAAHSHCNKLKGNTAVVDRWRHPSLISLPVAADNRGNAVLLLP